MHNLLSKSIYHSSLAKAALLAAMALCGATTPAQAQEEVGGKFTLQGNARWARFRRQAHQWCSSYVQKNWRARLPLYSRWLRGPRRRWMLASSF